MKGKRATIWATCLLTAATLLAGGYAIVHDLDCQKMLSEACWDGNITKAKVALFCGADINRHPGGTFPNLVAASRRGDVKMMDFLLSKGANLEQKDKFGGTALSYAAQNRNQAAVEFLISRGAKEGQP